MKLWKNSVLYYTGGLSYLTLELLWRGRSHGSMFLAGGLCFLLIGNLKKLLPGAPLALRAAAGSVLVTMVELGFGLAVNRDYLVWDYRDQPGNFMGQICPLFSLLWIPVSLAAILLFDRLDRALDRKLSPK